MSDTDEIAARWRNRDRRFAKTAVSMRDLVAILNERDRLRAALMETLAIASRNEGGDYIDRARSALDGK